jgi:hypothetical protein
VAQQKKASVNCAQRWSTMERWRPWSWRETRQWKVVLIPCAGSGPVNVQLTYSVCRLEVYQIRQNHRKEDSSEGSTMFHSFKVSSWLSWWHEGSSKIAGEVRYPRLGRTIGDRCDGAEREAREATRIHVWLVGLLERSRVVRPWNTAISTL